MTTLLSITECYRLDTQAEVDDFMEEVKDGAVGGGYTLSKYSSVVKNKKAKGEIIDTGYLVTVVKDYNTFFND